MKKIIYFFFYLSLISFPPTLLSTSEKEYFNRVKHYAKGRKQSKFENSADRFLKKYPRSRYRGEVMMLLAENEESSYIAIRRFKNIMKLKHYKYRDFAQFRICEIYALKADWKNLEINSYRGFRVFHKSPFVIDFHIFYITALTKNNRLSRGKQHCKKILKKRNSIATSSKLKLLLSIINKKMYGESKSHLIHLIDILKNSPSNRSYTEALYLLGKYYQKKKKWNRAFSVYSEIVKNHSSSPEASYSKKRIHSLKKYSPRKVDYFPNKKVLNRSEDISITPEIDYNENIKIRSYYSLSIGPFRSLKKSRKMKKHLREFRFLKIIKARNRYIIYAGKITKLNRAIQRKLRLAEEWGINASIVRISGNKKKYIYGEYR